MKTVTLYEEKDTLNCGDSIIAQFKLKEVKKLNQTWCSHLDFN